MTYVTQKAGFTIRKTIDRPSPGLVDNFRALVAANISDVQGRHHTLDYRIKPIYQPMATLVGPAVTVRARPGDNMVAFKAIELAEPGDVIVISGSFESTLSVWGGIMSAMAKKKGIAGLVTDCLVRDVSQTREVGFPVFATGLTPSGPTKSGVGEINTPISCGGVIIQPGDIIVADEDGVVAVRKEDAEQVYERTLARVALEQSWLERIERGELFLIETDDELRALGALIHE